MRLDIHTAKREEAAAISRIYAASWRQAYRGMVPQHYLDELPDSHWTEALGRWIDDPEVSVAAAYLDGTPVGGVVYRVSQRRELPGCLVSAAAQVLDGWGEVVSLYVRPDAWRRGCGGAMLRHAAAELSAASCEGGFLWVLRENLPARRFYESNGWSDDGATCTVELAGVPLTDLRYRQNWK
ncbi:GNAT family N-acetyltransferase [Clostridiaceae bacterium NSJ-31]|uniref:GNAT family N-acetyltransferase n=3 Tax=Ligaoa zhengdingensis TaxID=2763658 RepID=A0A926DUI6_9FIRM|nr:GNAT family N-acetyltransferase [Ligaoa zhengdingensis]MBC8545573.1 GNAT family N-acetyltransferase [Ligaoa zhengdingensis]